MQSCIFEDIQRNDNYPRLFTEPNKSVEYKLQLGGEISEQSDHSNWTYL